MAIAEFVNTFTSSIFFIPSLLIATAVGSVLFFKEFIDPEEKEIEEKALKEVVQGEVDGVLELFGSDIKKKISYGMTPMGVVKTAWAFEQYTQIDEKNFNEEKDNHKKKDGEPVEYEEMFYFKIRPEGWVDQVIANITDDILNMGSSTDYVVVEQDYVSDGEVLSIADSWNPVKVAGVWIPDSEKGASFVRDKTAWEMFEDTLETAETSIRSINLMNLKFAQNLEEMEKKQELISQRYGSKAAEMVNEE